MSQDESKLREDAPAEEPASAPPAPETASSAVEAPAPADSAAVQETDEDEPKVPYEILETQSLEGSVIQYKVSVPRASYDEKTESMFKELGSSVVIDGFRPGKAPRNLLKIRFGKDVEKDASRDLAMNVARQIIEAADQIVLSDIDLKDSKTEGDGPIELTFEYEIRPKIAIKDYKGLAVEASDVRFDDEAVDRELERLRERNAQYKTAPDGAKFEIGQGGVYDYEVLDAEGRPLSQMSRQGVFQADLAASLREEIRAQLAGLEAGQSVSADIESTHRSRRGEIRKSVDTHRLTLKEIKIRELPALDDEFAKDLGAESLEKLREQVRGQMQANVDNAKRAEALSAIFQKILENNPFSAPKSVVAVNALDRYRFNTRRMAMMGLNMRELGDEIHNNYIESVRNDSEQSVKLEIVVDAIAKAENIAVAEEDVEKEIERMAEAEGRRPLAIRARLERDQQLESLKDRILAKKVEDYLLANSTVTYVEPKPPAPESQENAEAAGADEAASAEEAPKSE